MDGSKAREIAMAADVDALVDGNGDASWQVDDSDYPPVHEASERSAPTASLLAISLNDVFRAYEFDGLISISHDMVANKVGVHVRKDYFDRHYKDGITSEEQPAHGYVQHSVDFGECYVYCIEHCKFKMVREDA